MVGAAISRALATDPTTSLLTVPRAQVDLRDQSAVSSFFSQHEISEVYLAAAKVGGIHANNTKPAEFIANNLQIQTNIITSAYQSGVAKLLFLGSSCIYPRNAEQPMAEESLLTGVLEPTNEPYAIAKIAGIKTCEAFNRQYGTDYRSLMPTNLYGPGDNFHAEDSHVIPALIRRIHEAHVNQLPKVTIWGTGMARREFLHVDDLAKAAVHIQGMPAAEYWSVAEPQNSHINIGTGQDLRISELASLIAEVVGYEGRLEYDKSKPDGTPRKLLDIRKARMLGWQPTIDLRDGIESTYHWFLQADAKRMG